MLGYQGHNKNMTCVTWQGYNMTCVAVKKQQQSVKFPLTLTNDASVPKCSYFPRHPPGWLCRLSTWYWWCFPCCPAWQARKRSVRKMMEVINWKELFTMKRTWYFYYDEYIPPGAANISYIRRDFGAVLHRRPLDHIMKHHSVCVGEDEMLSQPCLSKKKHL